MTHTYLLGNKHIKDERGGDAGCLYKYPNSVLPRCFFVRASLVLPMNSTMTHPELKSQGKSLKQFYVTSGLGIVYENDFSVDIYNIQRPGKDSLLMDYSLDYINKVI